MAPGLRAQRAHPAFYALEQGRYSVYLRTYLELFGESSVYISFYEDLRRGALGFIIPICRWLGIDEAYFRDFQFDVINKGSDVHSRYLHKAYHRELAARPQLISDACQSSGRCCGRFDPEWMRSTQG